jgi:hypothetical protein
MKRICLLLVAMGSLAALVRAAEQPTLDSHLESLRPLLEKTWKGPFKNSKPDQPMFDVARWERALNGRAVRVLHSVNDGIYGGESLLYWDDQKQEIVTYYFTTAGYITIGTLRVEQGKFVTHETVRGTSDGISEVRGTHEVLPDGALHVKSEYFKNGQWVPGHEIIYREDASAKVVFR